MSDSAAGDAGGRYAQRLPRDLITAREAVDAFGMKYERLKFWWMRGKIRYWKVSGRVVVSRAEVLRELRKRDSVTPGKRKDYMGEIAPSSATRPSQAAASPERPARSHAASAPIRPQSVAVSEAGLTGPYPRSLLPTAGGRPVSTPAPTAQREPPTPLPELPDPAPGWVPAGPWDYSEE